MASSDTYFSDQDDYDYDYDDCYDRAFEYDDFCANSSRGGGGAASMSRRQVSKRNQKKKCYLGVYSSKHVRAKESLIANYNGMNRTKANRSSTRRKR